MFDYNEPIIHRKRKGTTDDPFVSKNDTLYINSDGTVNLTELPDAFNRVKVTGDNKEWFEIQDGIPNSNQFKVDYTNKIVTFNLSNIGKQLNFEYFGKGLTYIPTSMIYTKEIDGEITETLKQLTDETITARDSANSINTNVSTAESVRVSAESTRVTNENNRITSENNRNTNESTRTTQENARVAAETARQTNTTTAITNANDAATNATTQANFAQTQGNYAKAEADRLVGTDVSVLDNKIGVLTSLNTTNKTNMVGAVNEVVSSLADMSTNKADKTEINTLATAKANQTDLNTTNSTVALKADKTYVDSNVATLDTKINSQASGSPKGTYATLVALQTAFPTGNTNIYVVTADGNWYYWNGSAWTSGGVYQSTGIGNKTVSMANINDDVKAFQYPFQEKATLSVSGKPESILALRDGIFDIKLYGANPSKNYSLSRLQRKNGASVVNAIDIWDSDTFGIVASFYAANYSEPTGIDTVSLSAMNASGITAKIMIDWSKFPNPTDYNSLIYANCGISKKCYVSRITDSEASTSITTINNTLTNNQILMHLKDVRIFNAKSGHVYGINTVKRNSSNVWQIDIWDFTDSKYVCSFYRTGYTEPTGMDSITLATLSDSITATMNIQWSKLPTGNSTSVLPIYVKNPAEQTVNARRWEGKYWYAVGDSITEQNNYPYFLNQYAKFASYYNAGQSGKGMKDMTTKFATEPLTNYDLITVFAGTNDYGGHTPLGTINDTKDTLSFYGYTKKVIDTILTAKPSIKLAFFTPLQRGAFTGQPTYPAPNNLGHTLDQYVDAIKKVCELYAIPCLDLFRCSGINEYTLTTMTTDNLHINNGIGGQTVARTIQGFIEAL